MNEWVYFGQFSGEEIGAEPLDVWYVFDLWKERLRESYRFDRNMTPMSNAQSDVIDSIGVHNARRAFIRYMGEFRRMYQRDLVEKYP